MTPKWIELRICKSKPPVLKTEYARFPSKTLDGRDYTYAVAQRNWRGGKPIGNLGWNRYVNIATRAGWRVPFTQQCVELPQDALEVLSKKEMQAFLD